MLNSYTSNGQDFGQWLKSTSATSMESSTNSPTLESLTYQSECCPLHGWPTTQEYATLPLEDLPTGNVDLLDAAFGHDEYGQPTNASIESFSFQYPILPEQYLSSMQSIEHLMSPALSEAYSTEFAWDQAIVASSSPLKGESQSQSHSIHGSESSSYVNDFQLPVSFDNEEDFPKQSAPSAIQSGISRLPRLRTLSPARRRSWTTEEDAQLLDVVSHISQMFDAPIPWSRVADCMPDRTAKICSKRYHVLRNVRCRKKPQLNTKGSWTKEEDLDLLQQYEIFARLSPDSIPWTKIGLALKKPRTGLQVCARYTEALDSSIVRGRWSKFEDELLLTQWAELGGRWAQISSNIPGRTQRQCASRFNVLNKRLSAASSPEALRSQL